MFSQPDIATDFTLVNFQEIINFIGQIESSVFVLNFDVNLFEILKHRVVWKAIQIGNGSF